MQKATTTNDNKAKERRQRTTTAKPTPTPAALFLTVHNLTKARMAERERAHAERARLLTV